MSALQLKLVTSVAPTQIDNESLDSLSINTPASPANEKISAYIRQAWNAARNAKQTLGIERRIEDADRRREHKYEPKKLEAIRTTIGGSEVYLGLADYQARKVQSWLSDLLFGQGDKPWTLEPTPIPELPGDFDSPINEALAELTNQFRQQTGHPVVPQDVLSKMERELRDQIVNEIVEDAKGIARRMEQKIDDQFTESKFYSAIKSVLSDLVTYPTAFLKGPLLVHQPKMRWTQNPDGSWDVETIEGLHLLWQRIDPRVAYPAPNAKTIHERYFCELARLTRRELGELKNTPGVDNDVVDLILAKPGIKDWLGLLGDAEREPMLDYNHPEALFDVLLFWGDMSGADLIEWGVKAPLEASRTYSVCAHMISEHVFKITMNYHPMNRKPIHTASFEIRPDSIWGKSAIDICAPFDELCNANARALSNNMGLASGPQVGINIDRLAAGQNLTQMVPWKLWQFVNSPYNDSTPPVNFFQPDDRVPSLLSVFQFWSEACDEYLGMPRIMTGVQAPTGAGRTATGFAMFLENANKPFKQVVLNLDGLIESAVNEQYVFNMRYLEDPAIKGDLRPKARGATALSIKEAQQLRRTEFLATLANPIDADIIPSVGRAHLIRENARDLNIDPDRIISPELMAALAAQGAAGPPQPQGAAPAAGSARSEPSVSDALSRTQGGAEALPPMGDHFSLRS